MARVLTHNQIHKTPQDALSHYGTKGTKWGVRNDRPTGGTAGSTAEELGPAVALLAIFGGIAALQARYAYVDSGKRDAKIIDKAEKKSGVKHEWPKKDGLSGPMTEDQLMKNVIPDINRGFPKESGTSMNCRRCTFAYEMRRRGYDVKATKSAMATGQDTMGLINATTAKQPNGSIRTINMSKGNGWGANTIPTTVNGKDMAPEGKSASIFDALGRQPNGSRGELAFSWTLGGGHSVAYEVVNNKPVVFCTQTKRSWSSPDKFAKEMGPILGDAAYTRLDNADINEAFIRRWVATNA
jgi:hypothetical protein